MRKKVLLAVLLSSLILLSMEVSARGTGTQADPFRIKSLVFDAYFVSWGGGSMTLGGTSLSSSSGSTAQVSNEPLADGTNTIYLHSNKGHNDGCCAPPSCDAVMAVVRIGNDDNDIIYTQAAGWSGAGGVREYGGDGCAGINFPWTTSEKCVNNPLCGDCCETSVSTTFYVILVESVPPAVTVTGAPAAWANTNQQAGVGCSDSGSGCSTSSYRIAVYPSNPGTCPADYSSYALSSPQTISDHSWVCAAAKDNEENTGFSSPAEFKIEKIPPTGTISIDNGNLYTTSNSVTLSLTYSDTGGSGIKDCRYSNDGIWDTEQWEACTPPKSWTLLSGSGERTVYFQLRDNANNIYQTSDRIFLVFNTVCSSAPNRLYCCIKKSCNSSEMDIFHMSDRGSAYAELRTQNNYPYKACCGGILGLGANCAGSYDTLFRLYSTTNSPIEKSSLSDYQNPVCLSVNDGTIDCDYVNSPSACADLGPNYICVATMSSDTNANVSDCDGINDYGIKVCCGYRDITPPVTNITPDGSPWTGQDIQFSLSCSDLGGLCQSTYYKVINRSESCGTSGFSSGTSGTVSCAQGSACTNIVCYYSRDDSGNTEAVKTSGVFRIDKKPPVTTDNSDDNWHGNDVQITLACQDPYSGCNRTYYCVYNEGGTPCNPSIQGNSLTISCQQGTCRKIIRYYSADNSNNQESPHDSKAVKIDTSLPTCTMAALDEYMNYTTVNLSWSSATQGSPVSNVTIEKREAGAWEVVQTFMAANGSYDFTGQNNRTYYFRCLATNTLDEGSYSPEVSTTVDTGQPSASIALSSTVNTTTFNVSWSGDDAETGVSNYAVYYRIGPEPYSLWKVSEPPETSAIFGQDSMPVAAENNRTYTFKLAVTDKAGNSRDSNEVSVLVDTGRPNCTIQDMPAYQASSDFTVEWSGTDGESGIREFIVEQRVNGSWMEFNRGAGTSKDIANAQDGAYRFRCRAVDNASNTGDLSAEKATTVDVNPPDVQINYSDSIDVNQNLIIKATVTDAIKVSSATLYYNDKIVNQTSLTKSPNQSTWDVTWVIYSPFPAGLNMFRIDVTDVNGNSEEQPYQFMAKLCDENEVRPCGACGSGNSTCQNGNWTPCIGENKNLIKPEVCDGQDNDCNSIVDDIKVNGVPGNSIGSTHCQCYGTSLLSANNEECNGIDDDCDGQIDENGNCCNEGDTQPCAKNQGICAGAVKTCTGGKFGACSILPGSKDCASSLDNDCNGIADNQEPGCLATCADSDRDGYGSPGTDSCVNGAAEDCDDNDPAVYPGAFATCDGRDNNCDGSTADEETTCQTCSNGVQDANEEWTDCGGDCAPCFVWGWLFLTAGGVVILLILAFVWLHMKRQGRELTWEELKRKWTPSE